MIDTGQYGATAPISSKDATQRAFDNHRARVEKLRGKANSKGIAVSKVTAGALNELPYVLNDRFDMQDAAHAVAVIEVGDDFKVGRYGNWQGRYWALERSTTILYYTDSAKELRDWIKLCRQAHDESKV